MIAEQARNEKPPAACAGGGLESASLLNAIDQASFPARGLWLLIRMPGMHGALSRKETLLDLALKISMTLKQVDQSRAGCVKRFSCAAKTNAPAK